MAKRKTSATAPAAGTAIVPVAVATGGAIRINPGIVPDEHNPHSWLALMGDPPGCEGLRVMHGTLRCTFHDRLNTAEAFAAAKLRVADSADLLAVTALRHEVIAPAGVDDLYADPWLFGPLVDRALGREARGAMPLLCYVTITDPAGRLHDNWRRGRTMTERLVDRFRTPALLVQHAPGQKLRSTRPHLHLLTAVRTLGAHGYGAPIAALIGDKARDLFVDAWRNTG